VVFGEENLGEGSSREHAAMEPRFLGVNAKVRQDDEVSIFGFQEMEAGKPLLVHLLHADGTSDSFPVNHTYNQAQIEWVREGSALNKIRKDMGVA